MLLLVMKPFLALIPDVYHKKTVVLLFIVYKYFQIFVTFCNNMRLLNLNRS